VEYTYPSADVGVSVECQDGPKRETIKGEGKMTVIIPSVRTCPSCGSFDIIVIEGRDSDVIMSECLACGYDALAEVPAPEPVEVRDVSTREIFIEAVRRWGKDAQIGMVHEEIGELLQAINKYKRGKVGLIEIAEEIADVEIMVEQLKGIYDLHDIVKTEKLYKLERIARKLYSIPDTVRVKVGE